LTLLDADFEILDSPELVGHLSSVADRLRRAVSASGP
jgi:hypothetical protein